MWDSKQYSLTVTLKLKVSLKLHLKFGNKIKLKTRRNLAWLISRLRGSMAQILA